MYEEWPFFQSTMDLIEMILAKADMRIAAMYDSVLVSAPEEVALGQMLRAKFMATVDAVLEVGAGAPPDLCTGPCNAVAFPFLCNLLACIPAAHIASSVSTHFRCL